MHHIFEMSSGRSSYALGSMSTMASSMIGFALLATSAAGCGAQSRRDMSMPPREVTYSDACGLQDYFDQRAAAGLPAPVAADEMLATNAKGQTIGEGSYVLKDALTRRRFARLLLDEYSGIDSRFVHAVERADGRVVVHVRWWDAGPIRRLRRDGDVQVTTSNGDAEIPPNPCISDLLFGEKVYAMRSRYLRNEVDLATGKNMTASSVESPAAANTAPEAPAAAKSSASP
ncbi:MAG: hypothetical protein NVS3B20_17370 [Polyangiales bacterium]